MEINPNLSGNNRYDTEFIVAARSGVEEAFSELMKQYKFAIYVMLLKMVPTRADAEDLTIEVFGKAYSNIHEYDPQFSFSTWLFRIAYCHAIDHLEKKRELATQPETSVEKEMNLITRSGYKLQTYSDYREAAFIAKQNERLMQNDLSL